MPETTIATTTTAPADAVRAWFAEDGSRMTMLASRKFRLPERDVLAALVGHPPLVVTPLRPDAFAGIMAALPEMGPMRVFVRSRACVMEVVGTFGGYSEMGPFFNVQTDLLDMHILPNEIGSVFAVEKVGHDSSFATHSFQFFDHQGDAALKVFVWDNFPDVPAARVEAFRALTGRLAV